MSWGFTRDDSRHSMHTHRHTHTHSHRPQFGMLYLSKGTEAGMLANTHTQPCTNSHSDANGHTRIESPQGSKPKRERENIPPLYTHSLCLFPSLSHKQFCRQDRKTLNTPIFHPSQTQTHTHSHTHTNAYLPVGRHPTRFSHKHIRHWQGSTQSLASCGTKNSSLIERNRKCPLILHSNKTISRVAVKHVGQHETEFVSIYMNHYVI